MRISDWSSDVCSSDLRGLRSRAEELVSIELGPRPEHDIRNALRKEITAERWTRLDVEIRIAADETGYIDLRPETTGAADPESRRLMIGRVQYLGKVKTEAHTAELQSLMRTSDARF